MHVLLTTDVVGGVWDFTWTLAGALTALGHRATILAFGRASEAQRSAAARAAALLIEEPLALEWMAEGWRDVGRSREAAAAVAREQRADVIHASQYALGSMTAPAPVVVTAHSDVLSWQRWSEGRDDTSLAEPWPGYAALVRSALDNADAAVAVTRFLAGELAALYRPERTVEAIHNGWPLPREGAPPPRPSARERLTLLAGRVWDGGKNVGVAAAAARGFDAGRVVLAGDQRHPETGSLAAVDPPLEALGFLPRATLDGWLGRARIYLSPARYDPFGLLPLQAALAGCALLLADIPSYRELWDGAALFFPPREPDALRRRWQQLLEDDSLADDLARGAHARARSEYSAEGVAERYLACYRKVARGLAVG